jgi:hypothetical protein
MEQYNSLGRELIRALKSAQYSAAVKNSENVKKSKIHIAGVGRALTAAYEQLRNAADYSEDNMLMQRAIKRFYHRLFVLRDLRSIEKSGEELIIEMTLAGYLDNDSQPDSVIQQINNLAIYYYDLYRSLDREVSSKKSVDEWTVNLLATEVEMIFHDYSKQSAFIAFSYDYFYKTLRLTDDSDGFNMILFTAIHESLLKSNADMIRLLLVRRIITNPNTNLSEYIDTNKKIDRLFDSDELKKMRHLIDRHGAVFRVIRHMVDDNQDLEKMLSNKERFLSEFETRVNIEYESIDRKIGRGIIKSIVFLVITKFLIGIAIEVPYDCMVSGHIMWVPLLINLLFPPFYMVMLQTTLILPGQANTDKLVEQAEHIFYDSDDTKSLVSWSPYKFSPVYNVVYAICMFMVFFGVGFLLWKYLDFSLVHLLIFFIFLSAASFLGFRLSKMVREIETVDSSQNIVTVIRDFLYMPFVVVGRFISDKYAKINIVAAVLDMAIELPLKTVLHLIRQWSAFINSKKDQL